MPAFGRLALHTWTVDTTLLAEALAAARDAGFDAAELRYLDFKRCREQGMADGAVLDLVRGAGLPVCTLGCEYGWLFASGEESERLFKGLEETCRHARALDCPQIMCAPGPQAGPLREAIERLKRGADIVGAHGLTLAIEFNSQHAVLNSVATLRELIHAEIAAFQYSDVPAAPLADGVTRPTDRLPPGQGVVRWTEVLQLLKEKGFAGPLSYEAPNPALWARPAADVAREGVAAMRSLIRKAVG